MLPASFSNERDRVQMVEPEVPLIILTFHCNSSLGDVVPGAFACWQWRAEVCNARGQLFDLDFSHSSLSMLIFRLGVNLQCRYHVGHVSARGRRCAAPSARHCQFIRQVQFQIPMALCFINTWSPGWSWACVRMKACLIIRSGWIQLN